MSMMQTKISKKACFTMNPYKICGSIKVLILWYVKDYVFYDKHLSDMVIVLGLSHNFDEIKCRCISLIKPMFYYVMSLISRNYRLYK